MTFAFTSMGKVMLKRLLAALGFLTVMPLPGLWRHTQTDLIDSVPFFPLVGLLIGLSAAGIAFLAGEFFPDLVLAVLLVGWLAMVHGGLHLDGLADTADGFLSPHDRERILVIMHDSRIGVFGCLAIGGILALKVAALASLPNEYRIKALLLAPLVARCVMVSMLNLLPPARPDGLGRLFYRHLHHDDAGRKPALESIGAVVVILAAGWVFASTAGLVAGMAVMVAMVLFGTWCRRRIGGRSGDTVGAASEISEMLVLVVFSVLVPGG